MRDNREIKKISLIVQEKTLLKAFPESKTKRSRFKLSWKGNLKPTALSREYTVEVILNDNNTVEIFVKEPKKLRLYKDEKQLPHTYSTTKQKLCLFYPNNKEWSKRTLLVDTIIPWASEWLFFYEIWLFTGEWLGGGIEHNVKQ